MILVDSSVWIDFFKQVQTPTSQQLVALLQGGSATVAVADLVIYEVLRGFRHDKALDQAKEFFSALPRVDIGGFENAVIAADHYRVLRAKGYTVRSPIDVLLASYCIANDHRLLHCDADFDLIETLRGLKTWPH